MGKLTMDKYIIKSCGKMSEIIAALKTLKTITGNGATVSDVVTLTNYTKITNIVKNQFNKEV